MEKSHFFSFKSTRPIALLLLTLLACAGQAWGGGHYVFKNKSFSSHGYLYNNGGTVATSTTLCKASIWITSDDELKASNTSTIQSYSNTGQYLCESFSGSGPSGSGTVSLSATGQDIWRASSSAYDYTLITYHGIYNYYLRPFSGGVFKTAYRKNPSSTGNTNYIGDAYVCTQITNWGDDAAIDQTTAPAISFSSISGVNVQLSRTNLGGTYQPACHHATIDGSTRYWTDAMSATAALLTSRPTTSFSPTYTWSIQSGPATINSSTGLVTITGAGTIVVKLTTSNISPLANKETTFTIIVADYTAPTEISVTAPTLSPSSATLAYDGSQAFTASGSTATKNTYAACKKVTINSTNWWVYNGTAYTTEETYKTAAKTTTHPSVSYSWSKSGAGATYLSLSSASGTSTTATANNTTVNTQTATLTATATAEGQSNNSSSTITINGRARAVFYYTSSVEVVAYNTTSCSATVTPSGNGSVQADSWDSPSANQQFTFTASYNANLQRFDGWSETPTGPIISTASSYTHSFTIDGTSSVRTPVKLYARFTPMSLLCGYASPAEKGIIFTDWQGVDREQWEASLNANQLTSDCTDRYGKNESRSDEKHVMYFYAKANANYKFYGWSKDNNINNRFSTEEWDTLMLLSPQYATVYAHFIDVFRYSATANVSTFNTNEVGGTATAQFASNGLSTVETDELTTTGRNSQSVTFTATAASSCFYFDGWYTDAACTSLESTANPYTTTLTNTTSGLTVSKTLYAKFVHYKVATPTISFAYNNNTGRTTCTLNCSTAGSAITYTVNGGTPQTYTSPFIINVGDVVRAQGTLSSNPCYLPSDWAQAIHQMYVIMVDETHYLGGTSTTNIGSFNPQTCLWTGTSGGTWRNTAGYYLRYSSGLSMNASNSSNWTLSGTESGTTGQIIQSGSYYLRYYNRNWTTSTSSSASGRTVVFAVTQEVVAASSSIPALTGDASISALGSNASFRKTANATYIRSYLNYRFYNNGSHYCELDNTPLDQAPGTDDFTYTWSMTGIASDKATINASTGEITYHSYVLSNTTATVTLTATSTRDGSVTLSASRNVTFIKPDDPTGISATSPINIYVGQTVPINYTLTPAGCYHDVVITSGNTAAATVSQHNVTGVAYGTATLTLTAKRVNGTTGATTTVTVNVRNKVATPVITFTPTAADDGLTATATLACGTPNAVIYYTTDGTTPTASSTPYTAAIANVAEGTTFKAIAIMPSSQPDYQQWDNSDVAAEAYYRQSLPTPTIQIAGNRVWFLCDVPSANFYYTIDGSDPTTSSTLWNGSEITTIPAGSTIKVFATKSGYSPSAIATKVMPTAHVVYLDFTNGNDNNDGSTAATAKKTWAGAYALLGYGPNAAYLKSQWEAQGLTTLSGHTCFDGVTDFTNTVDNNIIYLVGDVSQSNFTNLLNVTPTSPSSEENMMRPVLAAGYFKPVTISGLYAGSTTSTTGFATINLQAGQNLTLNEDTRFEYVEFYNASSVTNETQFILAYYDLEMGKGITTRNILSTKNFSTYHHGYAQGITNTAHILFYGGLVNDSRFTSGTKELQFDHYLPHPDGYEITVRSGYFSTISPGGKQWNSNINGAMGSPNTPVKCTITIDIDRAWNEAHKSGVLLDQSTAGDPDCDIAVVIAGTHEGSMYGDVDIIVKSGRIDRVVNGTFGANNQITGYPADSYFGRANTLIDPREPSADERVAGITSKDQLVVIRELYGGGLGRFKSSSSKTNNSATNFYGQSTLTINGGTFKSAIYASGAGGCNGIGDDSHHTVDARLPYGGNSSAPTYGDYAAWKAGARTYVKCYNPESGSRTDIDIADTYTRVEIHGGIFGSAESPIEGIFGGGYGYVDPELINYSGGCKPNTQAGSIFAAAGDTASILLIDGNTEIYGDVFGAGRGTSEYGSDYSALGIISGNVQVTLAGKVKVHGNVYGAGQGVDGMSDMARLYGNTTLSIGENVQVSGGVYGGGENGSITGNNSVTLRDHATIGTMDANANVHGGGYGASSNVSGNVLVDIGKTASDEPVVYGDVYGGSALGTVNTSGSSTYTTTVNMNYGTVHGDIYGGGLGNATHAANGYGPVTVNIHGGQAENVFGCNNVNGGPQQPTNQVNMDGGSILYLYGGGNNAAYAGTSKVHMTGGVVANHVFGGGLGQGATTGHTEVVLGGNAQIIKNVYGGGNKADVTGNTKVIIE